jgi:hypothetical protein
MDDTYFVYILLNPLDDNAPFYVGKGSNNRIKEHLYETPDTTANFRKFNTIRKILSAGYNDVPHIKVVENVDENTAYRIEEDLIKRLGRKGYEENGILTNLAISQRPPSRKGTKLSEETKKKISENRKGKGTQPHSAEHNLRVSQALKGKKKSESAIASLKKTMANKSPEEKEKLREHLIKARKLQGSNANACRRMAEVNRGKRHSEATRLKISEGVKAYHRKKNDEPPEQEAAIKP